MPTEVWMWILTALVGLLSATFGVVWKMLRDESKEHAENIKLKADKEKLKEAEDRWNREFERQDRRHDKEVEAMEKRLSDRMDSMENNIMGQMKMIMELIKEK